MNNRNNISLGIEMVKERAKMACALVQDKNKRDEIRKTAFAFENFNERLMFVEQTITLMLDNSQYIDDADKEGHAIIAECVAWLQNLRDEATATNLYDETIIENTHKPTYKFNEQQALINYNFWNSQEVKERNNKNIFMGFIFREFLDMIRNADFSELINKQKGISQRVGYNIYILSKIEGLGEKWGDEAAQKIEMKNLKYCEKFTEFLEREELRRTCLQ